jgi:hypothetical protein
VRAAAGVAVLLAAAGGVLAWLWQRRRTRRRLSDAQLDEALRAASADLLDWIGQRAASPADALPDVMARAAQLGDRPFTVPCPDRDPHSGHEWAGGERWCEGRR